MRAKYLKHARAGLEGSALNHRVNAQRRRRCRLLVRIFPQKDIHPIGHKHENRFLISWQADKKVVVRAA